ncbi:hypothetical protein KBY97_07180 [Synechococcus sp. ATX 2A4]|uniref:hypothetical protein n=1 Tax=Synechococcus sp. ATX 2A4 TaxID=2823727 RepID=UPI0020CC611E|nr:hypothetical protein [Synechococcus sp. ATX 2A4]MCP9884908.1 hypothetical protein [Synechococcus sp. ATX 2A4]
MEFSATALTEAQTHLHQLHQRLEQSNPALYRDLALYLQVLRAGLPQAVQQASFHLATQVVPARYMALDTAERLELQRRLQQLVQRCSALLTVEQLIVLARQVRSEQQRLRRREQKRLLAAMAAAAGEATGDDDDASEPIGAASGSGLATGLPRGSVQLGMDLPLSADLFAAGLPGLSGLSSLAALTSGSDEEGGRATTYDDNADNDLDDDPDGDETDDDGTDDRKTDDRKADDREPGDHEPEDRQSGQGAIDDDSRRHRRQRNRLGGSHGSGSPSDHAGAEADSGFDSGGEPAQMLQALFAMASEAMGRLPSPARDGDGDDNDIGDDTDIGDNRGGGDGDDHGLDDDSLDDDGEADTDADQEPGAPTGGGGDSDDPPYLLPRQPLELLHWWGAFDLALQRRLRNLSHAINLELLHLGLTRSLLPASLLDAVLRGQIEALPAPANLLRLSLPFGPDGLAAPVEALGLLLRSPDLEVEQPRLRTCRRRLEERRSELRTVARNYRHWQRRTLALEAEQQWLQDSRTAGPVQP